MTDAGASHLVTALDRLQDAAAPLVPTADLARVAGPDDVTAATAAVRGTLDALCDVLAGTEDQDTRDDVLGLLERAEQLEERLQRAVRDAAGARRERLERGLAELRSCENPRALLDRLCSIAIAACDADRVVVGLVDGDTWRPSRIATAGPTDAPELGLPTTPIALHAFPAAGQAVATGRATTSDDQTPGASLNAPIPVAGRVVALLHIGVSSRDLHPDDEALAERVGRVVGEAFELVDAAERLEGLTRAVDGSIERLRRRTGERPAADTELRSGPLDVVAPPVAGGATNGAHDPRARLTPRQLETLALILRGFSNAQIAEALVVSVPTVKTHVTAILRAAGASNRAEAISVYLDGRRAG